MRIKKCISALKISLFMACLLPSLFFAQGASAEYYQWWVSPPGQASRAFPDPYSACEWGYTFISTNWSRKLVVYSRESVGCLYSGNGLYWEVMYASLRGTECPDNGKYDEDARMCKTPPPECESGTPNLFRSSNYPIIVINGKNTVPSSPPSGCLNGCAYEADSSRPTSCYRTPGSTTEGFCNYTLKSNGQNCSADSGNLGGTGPSLSEPNQPPVTDPPSDPNDPGCPKGYSWSGTTCVKTPTDPTDPTGPKDPGGDGGGTGGGDGGGTGGGTGGGGDGGTGGGDGGTGGGDGNGGTGGGDGDGGGTGGGGDGGGDGQCDPAKDPNKCGSGS